MWQPNTAINEAVAGGASNVLWAWERGQVTGEQAMHSIRRLFEDYRTEFGL